MADLVENREAVAEQVVEYLVQQPSGAHRKELLAVGLVLFAPAKQRLERPQLNGGEGDDVVRADEEVDLAGI